MLFRSEFNRNSFITSALCRRILQRNEMASGDQDDLPIDEAERAPLQSNGSNGNGEVRALDNGHAVVPSENMRDFNGASFNDSILVSPRPHNVWDAFGRFRKILRNRYHRGNSDSSHASNPCPADSASNHHQAVEA